jgi:hypothetical protein
VPDLQAIFADAILKAELGAAKIVALTTAASLS